MKVSVLFPTVMVILVGSLAHSPTARAAGCDHPEFAATRAFSARGYPFAVAVGDFNGDGFADAANVSFSNNVVSVALGNGDGTLELVEAKVKHEREPLRNE